MNTPRIVELLSQVKKISETKRNPAWGTNPRRIQCGKVCNSAAAASDLGATKRNQNVTKELRSLASSGYLQEIFEPGRNFAFFRITPNGLQFLKDNTKT